MTNDNERKQDTNSQLAELRARRGTIKGQATKFNTYKQSLDTVDH